MHAHKHKSTCMHTHKHTDKPPTCFLYCFNKWLIWLIIVFSCTHFNGLWALFSDRCAIHSQPLLVDAVQDIKLLVARHIHCINTEIFKQEELFLTECTSCVSQTNTHRERGERRGKERGERLGKGERGEEGEGSGEEGEGERREEGEGKREKLTETRHSMEVNIKIYFEFLSPRCINIELLPHL